MEILLPADVESAALAELSDMLPAIGFPGLTTAAKRLGTRLPTLDPRPDEFGRLFATGGAARDIVTDSPTITVEGYAKREQRARDVCAAMVGIIEAAGRAGELGGVTCYAARAASLPVNLPHPQLPGWFRFTAMISVDLRRSAV